VGAERLEDVLVGGGPGFAGVGVEVGVDVPAVGLAEIGGGGRPIGGDECALHRPLARRDHPPRRPDDPSPRPLSPPPLFECVS
jgi:hypothetical protein